MGQSIFTRLAKAGLGFLGAFGAMVLAPTGLTAQNRGPELRVENQTGEKLVICVRFGGYGTCPLVDAGTSHIFYVPATSSDVTMRVTVRENSLAGGFGFRSCQREHVRSVRRLVVHSTGLCAINPLANRGPDGALPVRINEAVFARWSDGKWYPGRVAGFDQQGRVKVDFLDGDRGQFLPVNVRRDGLLNGSFVHLRRSSGPTRVQIVRRHGDALIISYGRGRRTEAVSMREVVLNEAPSVVRDPVGRTRARTLVNVCNPSEEQLYLAMGFALPTGALVTRGWERIAAGRCKVIDQTEQVMMDLPDAYLRELPYDEAPFARTFYYAQNEAAFARHGQAVQFAPVAGERRIEGDNANLRQCVMQLRNVAFRHVVDESVEGLGQANYCTDLNSAYAQFQEVSQSLNRARTGQAITINLE